MASDNPAFVLDERGGQRNGNSGPQHVAGPSHKDLDDDDSQSLLCGYGSWTPKWLQTMHNPKVLLLFLSMCAVTQGMVVNGLVPVSITTLEKRFNLNSTQSGLFSAFYDVAVVLALIPVCYWGNKGHKGRWIGWGILIMAIGSFIIASPQFITGPYNGGQKVSELCTRDGEEVPCTSSGSTLHYYLFLLMFGQLFNGFGAAPLYTLGISYIDESVSQRASPVYLGVYLAASTVGPALGFVIGGMLLKVWGDVGKSEWQELGISGTTDPRWYGAWWMAFLVTGVCAILCAIPVLGYAAELPGAKRQRAKDIDQTNDTLTKNAFGENLRDLPKSFWILTTNPTFFALTVMQTAEAFLMHGFITFVPKLFENLFTFSASKASLITGAIVVPMGFLGTIIGGVALRVFHMHCGQAIRLALIFNIISAALCLIFLTQCPDVPLAGVSTPYANLSVFAGTNLTNECNQGCNCAERYEPVCNKQLYMTFYSPCFAGCTSKMSNVNGSGQMWSDCSCAKSLAVTRGMDQVSFADQVEAGLCETSCGGVELFMIVFSLLVLATFCSAMPIQQAVLRVVPFQQRTMSLGFGWLFMRLFGSIPGAVFFGMAIDNTCILWKTDCGVQQTCLRYSSHQLSFAIFGFGMGLKILIVCSLVVAYWFYRPPSVSTDIVNAQVGSTRIKPEDSKAQIISNQRG